MLTPEPAPHSPTTSSPSLLSPSLSLLYGYPVAAADLVGGRPAGCRGVGGLASRTSTPGGPSSATLRPGVACASDAPSAPTPTIPGMTTTTDAQCTEGASKVSRPRAAKGGWRAHLRRGRGECGAPVDVAPPCAQALHRHRRCHRHQRRRLRAHAGSAASCDALWVPLKGPWAHWWWWPLRDWPRLQPVGGEKALSRGRRDGDADDGTSGWWT